MKVGNIMSDCKITPGNRAHRSTAAYETEMVVGRASAREMAAAAQRLAAVARAAEVQKRAKVLRELAALADDGWIDVYSCLRKIGRMRVTDDMSDERVVGLEERICGAPRKRARPATPTPPEVLPLDDMVVDRPATPPPPEVLPLDDMVIDRPATPPPLVDVVPERPAVREEPTAQMQVLVEPTSPAIDIAPAREGMLAFMALGGGGVARDPEWEEAECIAPITVGVHSDVCADIARFFYPQELMLDDDPDTSFALGAGLVTDTEEFAMDTKLPRVDLIGSKSEFASTHIPFIDETDANIFDNVEVLAEGTAGTPRQMPPGRGPASPYEIPTAEILWFLQPVNPVM